VLQPRSVGRRETDEIRKTRMGADAHSQFLAQFHREVHDPWISSMESARDVGRGQQLQQRLVVTHSVLSKSLTDVGDHVEGSRMFYPPCGLAKRPRTRSLIPCIA
jgi:hypothetical protein